MAVLVIDDDSWCCCPSSFRGRAGVGHSQAKRAGDEVHDADVVPLLVSVAVLTTCRSGWCRSPGPCWCWYPFAVVVEPVIEFDSLTVAAVPVSEDEE